MLEIDVQGDTEALNELRTAIERAIPVSLFAAANIFVDAVSPYPAAPSNNGEYWYERGYGPRWKRKDGSIGGRKTSETLGRRWDIQERGRNTIIASNSASYAGWVHDSVDQAKIHEATGWHTDKDGMDAIEQDNTIEDVFFGVLQAAGF